MEDKNKQSKNRPFTIPANWNKQAKMLKQKYSKLTDADLKYEKGKDEQLVTRISNRLNMSRDAVKEMIKKGETKVA
jgi:uncharacterized protein YjbJ (UPF0337 family)